MNYSYKRSRVQGGTTPFDGIAPMATGGSGACTVLRSSMVQFQQLDDGVPFQQLDICIQRSQVVGT